MRIATTLLILGMLAAGCGSGGGKTSGTAALSGAVYQLDGQTTDRSGVLVTVAESGASTVTGPNGSFSFANVPAGTVTLQFGRAGAALARDGDDDGDDDGHEDDRGRPVLEDVSDGDDLSVSVSLEGTRVVEFRSSRRDGQFAMARLSRAAGSPDADVEGKIRIQSRADREKFDVEAERLAPGTLVDVLLDDGRGFVRVGSAAAAADGEAELELNTNDGETLPLGVSAVSSLSGMAIEVRLQGTGETLLVGVVPDLPSSPGTPGTSPLPGERGRGRARLVAEVAGLEGHIEVRSRPEKGEERFEVETEHLLPGEVVTFQIENPSAPGTFVNLATVAADGEGEAEISTQDGLAMPLGVASVADLEGLAVRVVSADGSATLLLSGRVPALVAD